MAYRAQQVAAKKPLEMKLYLCLILTVIACALVRVAWWGIPVAWPSIDWPTVVSVNATLEPGATVDAVVYDATK